jgi:uncharacterized protein
MHYLLFYDKAANYAERQAPWTAAHLAYLQEAVRQGKLLLAGSLGDPVDGSAVLLVKADCIAEVEALAAADPYVVGGIVCRWRIRNWQTVLGAGADSPLPDA